MVAPARARPGRASPTDDLVTDLVAQLRLPGAVVAVVRPGQAHAISCAGAADVASGRPVEAGTGFRIGSITKTMTTLLVLRLVEARRVALDEPVAGLVDVAIRQPAGARPITVRDLLTHTSGIGELATWSALRSPLHAVGGASVASPIPSLDRLAATGYRAEVAPGEKWVYANPAYTLLGHLIERLEGRPFEQLVQEHIFTPCAMTASTLDPSASPTLATPYRLRKGRFEPVRPFAVSTVSAGGAISTAADLARYATMLLDGGDGLAGRVVGQAMLAEAFRVQFQPHPALKGIGLTFRIRQQRGVTVIGHNGSVPGWNASLVLCRERDVAVVALTNRAVSPSAEFGAGVITSAVLDAVLSGEGPDMGAARAPTSPADGATQREPAPPVDPAMLAEPASPVDRASPVGSYRPRRGPLTNIRAFAFFGGEVDVRPSRSGDLTLRGLAGSLSGDHPLVPDASDPFVFAVHHRGIELRLAFDPPRPGHPGALWLDGIPTGFRLHRVPRWRTLRAQRGALAVAVLGAAGAAGSRWTRRLVSRSTLV